MTDLTATDHTERDNFIKAICQAGYLTPKMAAFAWDNNWDQAKIWQARAALDDGAVSQDVELATLRRQLAENVEAMQQAADTYAFELSTRNTTIDSLRRQLAEREAEVERLRDVASVALSFAEHTDWVSVEQEGIMIPRDVWIDEASRYVDNPSGA